jgi:3-oxoacyl-[acyl-carrier-protein] synthase-3
VTAIRSVVLGCGSYLPERVLTNAELAQRIDTSDDWIVQRTGISERHIAADDEFTSHLAIKAAQAALAHAGPRSRSSMRSASTMASRSICRRCAPASSLR